MSFAGGFLLMLLGICAAILFDEKVNLGWIISIFLLISYMYEGRLAYVLVAGLFAIAGSISSCGKRMSDIYNDWKKGKE